MELFIESQGPLIALIGWAATTIGILMSQKYNAMQQRVLVVVAWMLWMIPGFNVLVTHGLIAPDDAIISYGMTTVGLILVVSLTAIRWQRTSKQ